MFGTDALLEPANGRSSADDVDIIWRRYLAAGARRVGTVRLPRHPRRACLPIPRSEVHWKSDETGQMSPVVDRKARLWELFKRGFSDPADLRERLSALNKTADQLAERVTLFRLSVRNRDFPLSILWPFCMVAKAVLRPLAPGPES